MPMATDADADRCALVWQTGIWDRISDVYLREIDRRFVPVIAAVVRRASFGPSQRVMDLGTGTGSVALHCAPMLLPDGHVLAVDVSSEMLAVARRRAAAAASGNVTFCAGRGEALPAEDHAFDRVVASLSLMYVIDRAAAAHEIARVLRPGGRLIAAVWAGPERCDIVRFQQTAGSFAPTPPVPGVGPGALGDPAPFLAQLAHAGITAWVETETLGFDFEDFASAWDALARVTAAELSPERQAEAKAAVRSLMWPGGDGRRHFTNLTQFIVGERRA